MSTKIVTGNKTGLSLRETFPPVSVFKSGFNPQFFLDVFSAALQESPTSSKSKDHVILLQNHELVRIQVTVDRGHFFASDQFSSPNHDGQQAVWNEIFPAKGSLTSVVRMIVPLVQLSFTHQGKRTLVSFLIGEQLNHEKFESL